MCLPIKRNQPEKSIYNMIPMIRLSGKAKTMEPIKKIRYQGKSRKVE